MPALNAYARENRATIFLTRRILELDGSVAAILLQIYCIHMQVFLLYTPALHSSFYWWHFVQVDDECDALTQCHTPSSRCNEWNCMLFCFVIFKMGKKKFKKQYFSTSICISVWNILLCSAPLLVPFGICVLNEHILYLEKRRTASQHSTVLWAYERRMQHADFLSAATTFVFLFQFSLCFLSVIIENKAFSIPMVHCQSLLISFWFIVFACIVSLPTFLFIFSCSILLLTMALSNDPPCVFLYVWPQWAVQIRLQI